MKNLIKEIFTPFDLEEQDLNILENVVRIQKFHKGTLLRNDEIGFIVILHGSFKVFILGENGKEIILFKLKQSDKCVVCADYIFEILSQKILIESLEESEIFIVPKQNFTIIREKYPKLNNYSLELISKRLNTVIGVMEQRFFVPLVERIRNFLKERAKQSQTNTIALSHEELANHLGSTREAVSRILKSMQEKGEILQKRKEIILLK